MDCNHKECPKVRVANTRAALLVAVILSMLLFLLVESVSW
jgi:hypothetical protein